MDPEQRTPREMTYKAGWKRSKIVSTPGKTEAASANAQPEAARAIPRPLRSVAMFNERVIWKHTPLPPVAAMKAVLILLPAAVFALFVWMVFWLSRFT
ncbi:hypothetical protein PAESOLCIP111_02643 [Paenibacillus solanacearum]|uniref:Uncharacterized protein n=1 Tax=Paenibacillus solanacearum TaxID=2048548 RepID=A0A916NPU8_9BACL|nr:hypothetical protein [Paenibacillus solanacearum]CAG7624628.1 hypothetical protein PAESOLCIP111_02643 [Paenibacillus solanacearum]